MNKTNHHSILRLLLSIPLSDFSLSYHSTSFSHNELKVSKKESSITLQLLETTKSCYHTINFFFKNQQTSASFSPSFPPHFLSVSIPPVPILP